MAASASSTIDFITISPYEKDYSAETDEPLFGKVAGMFESLADIKTYDDDHQDKVRKAFSRLDPIGSKPTNEFLEKVATAYKVLQKAESIWDEGWVGPLAFGGNSTKAMPDYILSLLVPPKLIQEATSKDMVDFISLRNTYNQGHNVLHLFKKAIAALDVGKEYPLLHRTPGKAIRTCATRKTILFVIRVYLAMTLCGYDKWEDIDSLDTATDSTLGTLRQKVSKCLQLLHASASLKTGLKAKNAKAATASKTVAATAAVPKKSIEEALSLKPESEDEDEDVDDEETETQEDSFYETQFAETVSSAVKSTTLSPLNIAPATTFTSYRSAIDFLQTQQEKEAATQKQLEKLQKQTLQQSEVNDHLSKTLKQCRSIVDVYKNQLDEFRSANSTLSEELTRVKQQQAAERSAHNEEVKRLKLENKKLLNDKLKIKELVDKM